MKQRPVEKSSQSLLALWGGRPERSKPMPCRRAFGPMELNMVQKVFRTYERLGVDFGYQGHFEKLYTDEFVRYQGGGYADAVCTGTMAVYVALAALQLPPGSQVLVSPITDPGTINAILLNRLVPKLVDSMPDSYNMGPEQVAARINAKTRALMVVHATGRAAPIRKICAVARARGIRVVEDCSQSHGACDQGEKVGTFGDIAAFSTMYRKNHATGGCGGVVFTRNKRLSRLVRAYADRGKPFWREKFDDKDPTTFLFPAFNLNLDEVSCAIGLSSLKRLNETMRGRLRFLHALDRSLKKYSKVCRLMPFGREDSPFFQPVFVATHKLQCSKIRFARAVQAEGIPVNPHYKYVVREWPYARRHLADSFPCRNAFACRNASFNLLFNERFGEAEARDTVRAIIKVESVYLK